VSPQGDWSQVRVWYGPTGGLGTSTYPTSGFIYADSPPVAPAPLETPLQIAGTPLATLAG